MGNKGINHQQGNDRSYEKCHTPVLRNANLRHGKGTQTQTFESGYFLVGGGLPRERAGAKKFGMSLETQGNQTFLAGYPGILLGYPGGARKV